MQPPASDLGTRIRQARATLRDAGPRTLLVKSLQELGLYRRLDLVEVPLAPRPARSVPTSPGFAVRELAERDGDLAAYAVFRPDAPPGAARERLQRGERCFLAAQEGQIVSAVWTASGTARIAYLQCEVQLAPHDTYAYDAFTLASRRGEDLASLRSELMKERLRGAGCARLIAAQLPENASQGRRAQRFGYRPLGVIGWFGIGPWRRFFVQERGGLDVPLEIRVIPTR